MRFKVTLSQFMRRTHLYLTLLMLPWFVMYAVTALPFSHPSLFEQIFDHEESDWINRFDRAYEIAPPSDEKELRQWAAQVMKETGLVGSFGVYQPHPQQVNIWVHDFWSATQISYVDGQLKARDRRFRWDHFLTGMHARGGFQQESVLSDGWALFVDLVCLGMLIWIVTGFYMWWTNRTSRFWGLLSLASGFATFAVFVIGL